MKFTLTVEVSTADELASVAGRLADYTPPVTTAPPVVSDNIPAPVTTAPPVAVQTTALPTAPATSVPVDSPIPMPGVPVDVAPAAPSVPTAPAAPSVPTAPAADVELDADGVPWDDTLHAKNKSKNQDGTWRKARKSSSSTAPTEQPAPAAPSVPTEQPAPVYDAGPIPEALRRTPDLAPVGAVEPAPVAQPAPSAQMEYGAMMSTVATLFAKSQMTQTLHDEICVAVGIDKLPDAENDQAKVDAIVAQLKARNLIA